MKEIVWTNDSFPEHIAMRAAQSCADAGLDVCVIPDGEGGLFIGASLQAIDAVRAHAAVASRRAFQVV